jgi:hypothetical protein
MRARDSHAPCCAAAGLWEEPAIGNRWNGLEVAINIAENIAI